ncbi:hypothetical protein F5Y10DRAFT_260125 [Nemania abortiva]|nr:hypothetical protein F5Y10DRAFT_260125 [Nemania abortiva]
MEFDFRLYPEGGSNSLGTQNPEDERFGLILATAEKTRKSPLAMKATIKEVHHGKLKWDGSNSEGSLLLFHFHFKSEVKGRRYRKASVTLEFDEPWGRLDHYPAVIKVAPSDKEDRYLKRTSWLLETKLGHINLSPPWVDIGGSLENKDSGLVQFDARLTTEKHWSYKTSGSEDSVTWSIEENTGQEHGIPSFWQVAVLLRRVTANRFRVKLQVSGEVDWHSNDRQLLPVTSDVKEISLTPGTVEKGVNNSYITRIAGRDLLTMEELPMSEYYKVIDPCPW